MAHEERVLALLEQGRMQAEATEALRQARYKSEDADRVRVRAEEDKTRDQGNADREAKVDELEAAIAARGLTQEAQIAALQQQVAHLATLVPEPAVEPEKPAA